MKPKFSYQFEQSTVSNIAVLAYLNNYWGSPYTKEKLPHVTTDTTDLTPLHAYLEDHQVGVLHVHDQGTYRTNLFGLDILPLPKGTGKFTIGRERANGTVHAAFRVHKNTWKKSTFDLMNRQDRKSLNEKL